MLNADSSRLDVHWKASEILARHPICRMRRLEGPPTSVMGTLNGQREYAVLIDTGSNQGLIVNDVVALESGLAVYPAEASLGVGGLCDVEQITIDDVTLRHPPCLYTLGHYERRALARPTQKERQIILGLRLMRGFRYLLIDHPASEVTFGVSRSFAPDPNESWRHFPLEVDEGDSYSLEAIAEIPLAGRIRRVKIDTAASWNLYVGRAVWENLSREVRIVGTSRSRSKMFRGWSDIEIVTVEQWQVGSRTLPTATIAVHDESADWKSDTLLLGMANFLDTAIVLDFEHHLFWIRHP